MGFCCYLRGKFVCTLSGRVLNLWLFRSNSRILVHGGEITCSVFTGASFLSKYDEVNVMTLKAPWEQKQDETISRNGTKKSLIYGNSIGRRHTRKLHSSPLHQVNHDEIKCHLNKTYDHFFFSCLVEWKKTSFPKFVSHSIKSIYFFNKKKEIERY